MNKEEFVDNVKKWVILDSQIKHMNEKTKQLREAKTRTTQSLCSYMTHHSIEDKRIDISDGYLKYTEKNEYSPLTYTYIEECLDKIIKNQEQVQYIIKYLKDNREIKTSLDIRRNIFEKK